MQRRLPMGVRAPDCLPRIPEVPAIAGSGGQGDAAPLHSSTGCGQRWRALLLLFPETDKISFGKSSKQLSEAQDSDSQPSSIPVPVYPRRAGARGSWGGMQRSAQGCSGMPGVRSGTQPPGSPQAAIPGCWRATLPSSAAGAPGQPGGTAAGRRWPRAARPGTGSSPRCRESEPALPKPSTAWAALPQLLLCPTDTEGLEKSANSFAEEQDITATDKVILTMEQLK